MKQEIIDQDELLKNKTSMSKVKKLSDENQLRKK
jgi:hypothetical protein